jgi:hypothetical protein
VTELRGIVSPIEDVVAEAERRAEALHRRATEPCPHEITERRLCDQYPHCAECGAELID